MNHVIDPLLVQHNHEILSAGSRLGYQVCVLLATLVGGAMIRQQSLNWPMPVPERWAILLAALLGSMIGCALPAYFAGGLVQELSWSMPVSPKTVMGGLLLSYGFVVAYKKLRRNHFDTSDSFATGAVAMMAIGRIGCIFQHCCYGRVASWGLDLGDGQLRLPVQYLEAAGLFVMLFCVLRWQAQQRFAGRRLFLVFAMYGAMRLLLEFWRQPIADEWLGLGFYQAIALGIFLLGVTEVLRRSRALSREQRWA